MLRVFAHACAVSALSLQDRKANLEEHEFGTRASTCLAFKDK